MKQILAILLIVATLSLSGCETFNGLGRDMEKAGEWVQEKAN
jgi:predicted small secreted protein